MAALLFGLTSLEISGVLLTGVSKEPVLKVAVLADEAAAALAGVTGEKIDC